MKQHSFIAVLAQLVALFQRVDIVGSNRDARDPEPRKDDTSISGKEFFAWQGIPIKDYIDPQLDFKKCETKCIHQFRCAAFTFYIAHDGHEIQLHCLMYEGLFTPTKPFQLILNKKTLPDGVKPKFRSGIIKNPWLHTAQFPHKEYKYFSEHVSWDQARPVCKSYGGDLASLRSAEEFKFAEDIRLHFRDYRDHDPGDKVWLGLRSNPSWKEWLDGAPFANNLTPWNPGEPNNLTICAVEGEQCGQFMDNGLNDAPCHGPEKPDVAGCSSLFHPFICERVA